MNRKPPPPGRTPKDSHYARLRRQHRAVHPPADPPGAPAPLPEGQVHLYGLHTVRAALDNPKRTIVRLMATRNAFQRLGIDPADAESTLPFETALAQPGDIAALTGPEAVHQGVLAIAQTLQPRALASIAEARLVLVLDQVTDPHNVGAIMRSCVAFNAGALITTARHSPSESGVLAKAASGALEHINHITVRNLAETLDELHGLGFASIGLDSDGPETLEETLSGDRVALVLGAEGKGLRQKTRQTATRLARLDMPGAIRSLNVSNATAIALYAADRYLRGSS